MHTEKLSVSLPVKLISFVEHYRTQHALKSRADVISEALELLHQNELKVAYREANQEIDSDWDVTLMDGLSNETW